MILTRKGDYHVYATKDNLCFQHTTEPGVKSTVYTEHRVEITAICQHPVDDSKFAFGNAKGLVTILIKQQDGEWIVEKEFSMVSGCVRDIVFTEDGERIIAVGEGQQKASAIMMSTGNKVGDILGALDEVYCCLVTPRPFHVVSAGLSKEILLNPGVPFKGQGTPITHDHSKGINRVSLSPDNTRFVTASLDKQIGVFDAKTFEQTGTIAKGHTMGIYDALWVNDNQLATCSADNRVKVW